MIDRIQLDEVNGSAIVPARVRLRLPAGTRDTHGVQALAARLFEHACRRADVASGRVEIAVERGSVGHRAVVEEVVAWQVTRWALPPRAIISSDSGSLVLDGRSAMLGRDSPAARALPELAASSVSRHHAEVLPWRGRWAVRDSGSRHGTKVDGVRVADVATPLPATAVVELAGVRLHFRYS
ncbi:MAG: FHA domain-containing protein [Microthrixaceae bacterium]